MTDVEIPWDRTGLGSGPPPAGVTGFAGWWCPEKDLSDTHNEKSAGYANADTNASLRYENIAAWRWDDPVL